MSPRIQRLPYFEDSTALFASIRHLPWPVFLDSARPMIRQGRYDILAAAPYLRLTTRGEYTEIRQGERVSHCTDDPFRLLRDCLGDSPPPPPHALPFQGGAIGCFAYDLGRRLERLPILAQADDPFPEMVVGLYDWALVVDHRQRRSWLVGQGRDAATHTRWAGLVARFSRPGMESTSPIAAGSRLRSSLSLDEYRQRFDRIKHYIREGDCYQVNFAQRFQARLAGDPWAVYRRLRRINPAPFSAFFDTPYGSILSTSPEHFLHLRERRVRTSPIKGTAARRLDDPAADRLQAEGLARSAKDRAENLMIVDLLRNDLGKVCEIGSIRVTGLFEIQSFARVHHLVSQVEGRLSPDEDAPSLLRACFPGGSITGAPKRRAMQIIEELEGHRRGIYCGALGYIGFDGGMDTNIAIRTLLMHRQEIRFWAGGGIVHDSDCAAEYQESLDKAAALFDLLGAAPGGWPG